MIRNDLDNLAVAANRAEPTRKNEKSNKVKNWPTRRTWKKRLEARRGDDRLDVIEVHIGTHWKKWALYDDAWWNSWMTCSFRSITSIRNSPNPCDWGHWVWLATTRIRERDLEELENFTEGIEEFAEALAETLEDNGHGWTLTGSE